VIELATDRSIAVQTVWQRPLVEKRLDDQRADIETVATNGCASTSGALIEPDAERSKLRVGGIRTAGRDSAGEVVWLLVRASLVPQCPGGFSDTLPAVVRGPKEQRSVASRVCHP